VVVARPLQLHQKLAALAVVAGLKAPLIPHRWAQPEPVDRETVVELVGIPLRTLQTVAVVVAGTALLGGMLPRRGLAMAARAMTLPISMVAPLRLFVEVELVVPMASHWALAVVA
jgi:hypothetical protein